MEFITDNFELLTKTPDSIDQLKQLVLDLAVRGLLAPQIEEEGDASVIIQKSNDLEYKVNHSRRKKKKTSAPISDDEVPFDIPPNWAWVKLGDVFNTTSGGTPTRGVPEYWNGEIPWLKSGELNDSIITDSPSEYITQEGLKNSSAKLFPKGALVIALYGATAGKLGILDYETTSNQAICAFFENPYISTEYLFCYLLGYRSKIVQDSWGQAQPNISQTYLKKFPFALPPKQEQQRIVQKVNTLFQQIDHLAESSDQAEHTRERLRRVLLHRLEQAPTQLETEKAWLPLQDQFDLAIRTVEDVQALRQTILQLAVKGQLVAQDPDDEPASVLLERIKGEKDRLVKEGKIRKQKQLPPISEEEVPFEVPEGWVWCRLGELANSLTNGLYKPAKFYTENGILSLRMYNIQDGRIDFKGCKRVEVTSDEFDKYRLEKDDILINRVNSAELVGKSAIIEATDERLVYESMNMRLSLIRKTDIATYINLFLKSSMAKTYFYSEVKQAIGQASINQRQVSKLCIPLPPVTAQRRIVEKVERLLEQCDELEEKIRSLEEKEVALVKSAMRMD